MLTNPAATNAAGSQVDGHSATLGTTADASTATTIVGLLKKLVSLLPASLVSGRLDTQASQRPAPSFSYITSATTTAVKTSAGVIRSVEITAPFTAGSLTVYNANNAATDPIAGFGANVSGVFLRDLSCSNGITVVTGAGFNGQVTVTYE